VRGGRAAAFVAAAALVTASTVARADRTPGRWVFEPGARSNLDFPVGDARSIIHDAFGFSLGLAAGREGAAHRWRASLGLEPVTDVGPGASLQLGWAQLGVEHLWWRHFEAALDLGAAMRRLSIGDELTRTTFGVGASAEVGWRFFPRPRWSVTSGVRYTPTWFITDGFLWQQIGVFFGVERRAAAPR
jgi:hypothetical protein